MYINMTASLHVRIVEENKDSVRLLTVLPTSCARLPRSLPLILNTAPNAMPPSGAVQAPPIDPLHLRHVFRGISVNYPEATISVYRNTLALYVVSIKTCSASLVGVNIAYIQCINHISFDSTHTGTRSVASFPGARQLPSAWERGY